MSAAEPAPIADPAGPAAGLIAAAGPAWEAYVGHAFVVELGAGTLPEAAFRRYLVQDWLFLKQFARAYALAAFKAETIGELRAAAATLTALTEREMALHVGACARWGLSEADLEAAPEALETVAYTRFALDRGLAGDSLDLQAALLPCVLGYAEIGRRLAPAAVPGHPYRDWIETYACPDMQAVARAAADAFDALWRRRGGAGRADALAADFAAACRLEAAFWAMGLAAGR